MSRAVRITPAGQLVIETALDAQPQLDAALASGIDAAFGAAASQGLLYLASQALDQPLPPGLMFWRDVGRRFFQAACQTSEAGPQKWQQLESPSHEEWQELLAAAPPMRGLEYLSAELLTRLWCELRALVVEQASRHPHGVEAYLQALSPVWHALGRVTFHLAENKRDPQRPFAFLATYTHRVSAGARVQHLPLGQALKQYVGAVKQDQLTALLEPVRRAAADSALIREMLDSRSLFQPQAWSIRQAHHFLTQVPVLEAAGLMVRVPDWWNPRRPPRPQVEVRIGQKQAGQAGLDGLLDFAIDLALDGEPLSADERRQLLQATEGLMLLRGRWVEVNQQRLQQALHHWEQLESLHADGISFIDGMRLLAGAQTDPQLDDQTTAEWSTIVAGHWLRDTLQAMREPSGVQLQPSPDLLATLRHYQVDGVRWLWLLTNLGLGACLADDMGLGKTLQVIDLLLHWKRPARAKNKSFASLPAEDCTARLAADVPSLIVVPASLIGNWKLELDRFAPSLKVFYAHRSECEAEQLARLTDDPLASLRGFDIVITTYGLVRRSQWLTRVPWKLVILDEAQAIKNAASAQTRAVKKLSAASRIALTGTPVENHLGDLWSIFDFCCPGLLGSSSQFKQYVKRLNSEQDATSFAALRRLVRPYILRRLKTDPSIVPDLPDKTEMRTECTLSKKQAALYQHALADLSKRLAHAEGMSRRGLVLSVLMHLKQICNHPAQYLNQNAFAPEDSGKFGRLQTICGPIIERQEKMLIFTQFQSLCQPLAEFLAGVFERPGLVLHGQTTVRKRSELVRQFQSDNGPPFLVISVKAGGTGLNLTAASHVVHFDRWWNPAVENQATDRAFRIGQRRNVLVHKFVCRGTVEERIDQMIREKQELADALLTQTGETMLTEMPDDQLLQFLALDLNRAVSGD